MPAPHGPPLTKNDLHRIMDGKRFYQAEADVDAGLVVDRVLYRNGAIQARWSQESDANRMIMMAEHGQYLIECTCEPFQEDGVCRHMDGLVTA